MKMNTGLLPAMVLLVAGACATTGRPDGPVVGREPPGREVTVENWTGDDLQVYAFYGGDVTQIGRVRSMNSRVLRLPDAAGGDVQLMTSPTGLREAYHVSQPIHVSFGQRVVWRLRATGGSAITYQASAALSGGTPRGRVEF